MKQFSIENKPCKVLFLSFILIASVTNYMYAKFYEVWAIIKKFLQLLDIQGLISDSNIYMA